MSENLSSNAAGSALAGVVSRILTHPLDTAKARLQVQSHYKGPIDVVRQTIATEGISGLYRGFGTVMVGGTPGTIIYLCGYDIFKEKFSSIFGPNNSFLAHMASGLTAEAVACSVYVPVDVIKERLQVQYSGGPFEYKGSLDALLKIIKTEGMSGIYKGYSATLLSFGPFSAFYFVFYEKFKHLSIRCYGSEDIPSSLVMSSSACAGAIASFITSPLDLAKLKIQVIRGSSNRIDQRLNNSTKLQEGVFDVLINIYESQGLRGIFRGAGARVLHFVPATTVTMTCYEACRKFFQRFFNEAPTSC